MACDQHIAHFMANIDGKERKRGGRTRGRVDGNCVYVPSVTVPITVSISFSISITVTLHGEEGVGGWIDGLFVWMGGVLLLEAVWRFGGGVKEGGGEKMEEEEVVEVEVEEGRSGGGGAAVEVGRVEFLVFALFKEL